MVPAALHFQEIWRAAQRLLDEQREASTYYLVITLLFAQVEENSHHEFIASIFAPSFTY